MVMDILTKKLRKEVPQSKMFADDVVLCAGNEVDMTEYLESRRKALDERRMKVSRPKAQWMECRIAKRVDRQTVKIAGEELKKVNNFKSLGAVMAETGGIEIRHRVSAAWEN